MGKECDFFWGVTKPIRDLAISYVVTILTGVIPGTLNAIQSDSLGLSHESLNFLALFILIFAAISFLDEFFMSAIHAHSYPFNELTRCFGVIIGMLFSSYFLSGYISKLGGTLFDDVLFVILPAAISILSVIVRGRIFESDAHI